MNDVLVSHSGKQHAYKHALSMQKIGHLARFVTSTYYDPLRFPDSFFSKFIKVDRILKKRYEPGLPGKVVRFPFFEFPELILRAVLGNSRISSNVVCVRDVLFDKFVAKTQIRDCRIFWGFQGSCLESLRAAKKRGIIAVTELATAHVTAAIKILSEEKKRNPAWADSISNLYFPEWYLNRLEKEPFVADYCVVASRFTRKTLEDVGVESSKILMLPLGVDLEKFEYKRRSTVGPFQILFVGGVGQRKGVKYLLDAVKRLNSSNAKLKVIGPIVGSGKAFKEYSDIYEYLGLLSQDEIVKHMHESNCLVSPSLFEGFGLVIPEAMATGMPVIASTHSAAPEIIREGIDGFVLEPADVDGLAEKLEWLSVNREKAIEMGTNASGRAKDFSWEMHGERLKDILQKIEQ